MSESGDIATESTPTWEDDPETLAMVRRIETNLFDAPAEPVRIGRFALTKVLGSGAMGVVHLAHDDVLDRRVAIKLIRSERAPSEEARARLLREARAMARLSHANVVQVYEAGEQGSSVFVAMELVEGRTLAQWLKEARPWPERLEVLLAAGRGLAAAHRAGIVHRDFKPDNVLLSAAGEAKVGDFGLAGVELAATTLTTMESGDGSLTQTGALIGTPRYMAPEQLAGLPADAQSDQFAFCVVAYEALVGQRPFEGDTIERLSITVSEGQLRPVPRGCRVPRSLLALIARGLSVDPARRWPDMDALLAALSKRRRRAPIVVGAMGAVAIAGIWLAREDPPETRCAHAHTRLEGIWDPARRDTTEAAMTAVGTPQALDTFARSAPELDRYATEWAEAYFTACASGEAGEAQMACLDHAREELRFVTDDLAIAQPDAVRHAVELVWSLPEIERCNDPRYVEASSLHDPELSATTDKLAHANVLAISRRLEEADALLLEVQSEALAHNRDTLEARALLLRSQVAFLRSRNDEAAQLAAEALALAERASNHDLALLAWSRMASADRRRGELDRASFELDRAAAHSARPGTSPETLADLAYDRASVLADQGKYADAVPQFEAALEYFRSLGPNSRMTPDVLGDMAMSLMLLGRTEEAMAAAVEAVELKTRVRGPTHPTMKIILVIAANVHAASGRLEDALRYRRESLAIAEQYPEDHPGYLPGLAALVGQDLVALGRYDEAEQALQHAAELARGQGGGDADAPLHIAMSLGNLELDRRRFDAARGHYESALEEYHEASPNRALLLSNLALAMASSGHFDDAITRASESLAIIEKLPRDAPIRIALECYAAEVHRIAGRTEHAREEFSRLVELLDRVQVDAESRFIVLFGAARLEPDRDRAGALALQAKEALAALPPASARHADFAEWSATHEAVR